MGITQFKKKGFSYSVLLLLLRDNHPKMMKISKVGDEVFSLSILIY